MDLKFPAFGIADEYIDSMLFQKILKYCLHISKSATFCTQRLQMRAK